VSYNISNGILNSFLSFFNYYERWDIVELKAGVIAKSGRKRKLTSGDHFVPALGNLFHG